MASRNNRFEREYKAREFTSSRVWVDAIIKFWMKDDSLAQTIVSPRRKLRSSLILSA